MQPTNLVGIEIGGTKLQVVLGNAAGEIRERRRMAVARDAGAAGIRAQIQTCLDELLRAHPVTAIGVGFGGPLNVQTGRIAASHQIDGWNDFDLLGWLTSIARVPVAIDNDANAGALAEALRGAGRGYSPVFYTTLGSGMGGGLVVNGAVYHGAPPGEAEIGLMPFGHEGVNCESRCCGWATDRAVAAYAAAHPHSPLAQLSAGHATGQARFLVRAIEAGDAGAAALLDTTAANIAYALSYVVHLMSPAVIVMGGGLSLLGEPLRLRVEQALPRFLARVFAQHPTPIRLAALGEDVVAVGALLLAQQAAE